MSGHSKWSTIKHKKAALDAKRGKVFTKIVKEITIAAREGGGDPAANPRLRTLLDKAKQVNMPSDNVQRAVKKGTGELPGQSYEAMTYEGYGPGGIAVIVDVLTDNKNRAVGDLRHLFSRQGGKLGETGSVNWMFDFVAAIRITAKDLGEDQLLELLLDYPVKDIIDEQGVFLVTADPKSLEAVRSALQAEGCEVKAAELEWQPKNRVALEKDDEEKAFTFLEALDDLEDVQNTYTNL